MARKRRKDFDKMPTFTEMKAQEKVRDNEFFGGLNMAELEYEGYPAALPVRYTEQSGYVGVFMAKYHALKRYLPKDPSLRPLQVLPGVTPLIIAAAESRATDIGPYNSVLVLIPIKDPNHIGYFSPLNLIPGFELLRQSLLQKKNHIFVWRIPDDSYISYKLGYSFFGMPKFASDIDYDDRGEKIVCSVLEEEELIFRMHCRKLDTKYSNKRSIPVHGLAYFYRDKLPLTEETRMLARDFGFSVKKGDMVLELGEKHPMAQELRDVLFSTRTFCCVYAPESNLIIYEPGRLAPDVLEKFVRLFGEKGEEG